MDIPVADITLPAHLEPPAQLERMVALRGSGEDTVDLEGGIRLRAIRQEGLRVGAQTGLAQRYEMIVSFLETIEPKLNVTYNFNSFLKDGRLLIPALARVENSFSIDQQSGAATETRVTYTVVEEASIVSAAPTWRDYLWREYAYPEPPHKSLLPRTNDESDVWKKALREGWRAGVMQADESFQDNMARLTQAVEGRHLYSTLEAQRVISPAALRIDSTRVTFNGRTMNVGETLYSVGQPVEFRGSQEWKPIWTR